MAKTITVRPHDDIEGDLYAIQEWCRENRSSFNSVFNSFIPAIAYAVTRMIIVDEETGNRYIRADFGDVLLREPQNPIHEIE